MSKNNYDALESQIGNLGGEEQPTGIGKLKNKASYGGKNDLSNQEQQDMNDFLAKSNRHKERAAEAAMVKDGWIPIDRDEMGVRSQFYPSSWEFLIRPATVQAIKNWTAIDEERPEVVNNVFNEIIKTCVKINTNDGSTASWNQINSWDRFWFILKVREYTYSDGQSKVEFQDECSECGEEIDYKLSSTGLFYEFPDNDLVEKYWMGDRWEIDPSEYDVYEPKIVLHTPTIASDIAIIDWATAKVRAGGKIDETFINYLTWLMPTKPAKDMQMLDRQITKIYKEYKNWSVDMFSFMTDVIRNITINQSEKLRVTCPQCGQEATSTVQFPNGIKVLFEVKTNAKKFGSR
jgi:hypothetical protein